MKWSRIMAACGIAALLFIATGLSVSAWQRANYTPFDDPLLDEVARRAIAERRTPANGFKSLLEYMGGAQGATAMRMANDPEFEWIKELEPTFGADPKYWDLRISLGVPAPSLQELDSRGLFTPYQLATALWRNYDSYPMETLALCDKVIKSQPDSSFAYYARCDLLVDQGRFDEALEACRLGNNAQDTSLPLPPQLRGFYADPEAKRDAESQVAIGLLSTHTVLPNFIRSKKAFEKVTVEFSKGQQYELADALWTRACREAGTESASTISMLVAGTKLVRLVEGRDGMTIQLSPEQLAEWEEIKSRKQRLALQVGNIQKEEGKRLAEMTPWDSMGVYRVLYDSERSRLLERPETFKLAQALAIPPVQAWARGELAGFLTPEEAAQRAPAALAEEAKRQQQRAEREQRKRENQIAVTPPQDAQQDTPQSAP